MTRLEDLPIFKQIHSFLIIGAYDGVGNEEHLPALLQAGVKGTFVEPVPQSFARLKANHPNHQLLNFAVSDKSGELQMLVIDPASKEDVIDFEMWAGSSSVKGAARNNLRKRQDIQEITVPCLTFEDLTKEAGLKDVDYLQIDTEGCDWLIFQQVDLRRYGILAISIETMWLTGEERAAVHQKLRFYKYKFDDDGCSLLAWVEPADLKPRFDYRTNQYSTHQPVLWHYAKKVKQKPILELGSGFGSTPLLHTHCQEHGLNLWTADGDLLWLKKFRPMQSDKHQLCGIRMLNSEDLEDWEKFLTQMSYRDWGLVFVDQAPWLARIMAIRLLKDSCDYMVVHDFDWYVTQGMFGKQIGELTQDNAPEYDLSDEFEHWRCFFPEVPWPGVTGPPTLVVSQRIAELTAPNPGELEKDFL